VLQAQDKLIQESGHVDSQVDRIVKEFEVERGGNVYRYYLYVDGRGGYVKTAEFRVRWCPMISWGCGNFVDDVLVVEESDDAMQILFKAFRVRFNYNGTGRDDIAKIVIDETVFGETPNILWMELYEDIETAEDFEQKVKEIIDFVKEYAEYLNPLKD
jgi:hypothetical protein